MRSSRLCVPISGCSPPGPGTTPSVASAQARPCSRLLAPITRWSTRAAMSEPHLAVDAGHRGAAYPGIARGVALHVHPPRATERRALAGDILLRRVAGADQPLGQGGVEAAGHGVFGHAVVAGEEGPHFEGDAV